MWEYVMLQVGTKTWKKRQTGSQAVDMNSNNKNNIHRQQQSQHQLCFPPYFWISVVFIAFVFCFFFFFLVYSHVFLFLCLFFFSVLNRPQITTCTASDRVVHLPKAFYTSYQIDHTESMNVCKQCATKFFQQY